MVETTIDSCTPIAPDPKCFNPKAVIPYNVTTEHIRMAMKGFVEFLGFVDRELRNRDLIRLEDMLMPANFSSMVGEFMAANIPKYCTTIVRNNYHNGHPDMLPAGKYKNDMAQHAGSDGIEIKGSRNLRGWQGHNVEDAWLMVFCFDSGRPVDLVQKVNPAPFRFLLVVGALLSQDDWQFAGRSEKSRRTITASVKRSGYDKMMANWIYKAPELTKGKIDLLSLEDES
jgi:hypothetical protein